MLYNRRRLLLTSAERQGMREACRFNAQLMDEVRKIIHPGVTTGEIDRNAAEDSERPMDWRRYEEAAAAGADASLMRALAKARKALTAAASPA